MFKNKYVIIFLVTFLSMAVAQIATYYVLIHFNASDDLKFWVLMLATCLPVLIVGTTVSVLLNMLEKITALHMDHKVTTNLLMENDEKFSTLFSMAPVGIALNKMSGEFVEVNDALLAMVGYDYETFTNLSYWDITPKKYEKQEAQQLQLLETTQSYGPYQKEYIHKDGHRFAVLLNGMLFKNRLGETFIWSIIQDISHIEEVKRELVEAKTIAELSSRAKSTFLANMSHEIRTPLNGIIGFVEKLQSIEVDEEKLGYLDTVKISSRTLLNIIKDILDISKIESNMLEIELVAFNLEAVFENSCTLFQSLALEKGITLSYTFDSDVPKVVLGDALRLKQVISNLISNAIKFTPRGGLIKVQVHYQNRLLQVDVIDNGVGIAKNKQEMIFDSFTQEDNSVSREYGGTGLGLHISKELIGLMGGKISVNSVLDKGTVFSFYVNFPEAALPEVEEEEDAIQILRGSILVAEDNKTNQMLISMILEDFGLECFIAENGKIALEMLKEKKPDLILMDINMPEMNGEEATQFIRKDYEYDLFKKIPIIALTANAIKGDRERFLEGGMDEYIEKPIDQKALYRILSRYLKVTECI